MIEAGLPPAAACSAPRVARRALLRGRVQGVGFRPFVHRLAREHGLDGHVRNLLGEVEILVAGPTPQVERFLAALVGRAPPLARPELADLRDADAPAAPGFSILASGATEVPRIAVPPDYFACAECLAELADPGDRRYRYPFINCTQCGPRYTLIESLPYDRANTGMRGFELCAACRREYEDPLDRRFHAEPVACPDCGPHLRFESGGMSTPVAGDAAALAAALELLRDGRVLAVRGIGGYHLLCDARSEAAVARLRQRKHRPHKPLAVMYPWRGADGLAAVEADFAPGALERAALLDPARPIVLLPRRAGCASLAAGVAPGLAEVGVFLPYSPLHQLLLEDFGAPLVATSGNLSGEPVLTDPAQAAARLADVADAFLHHDRPILRPADDPVQRVIAGRARTLRLGRGLAPLELELPRALPEPVLAVGGHLKLTLALAWERRVVVSPHVGDMGTLRSEQVFAQLAADLQALYGVAARRVLHDVHPDYSSTRWARGCGLPLHALWHHHAHASGLLLEHGHAGPAVVFAWDGVGLGEDGTLWGGETLVGRPGHWRRAAALRSFRLPGGERAGRSPWRSAAALCWEAGLEFAAPDPIVRAAWERGLNAPISSAAGRLFDAASALVLGVAESSFEGQGPMWLEAVARPCAAWPELPVATDPSGLLRIDWAPLLPWLADAGRDRRTRAWALHAALADAIATVVERLGCAGGTVGLTGGIFQNRVLVELAGARLQAMGCSVLLAQAVPCNDSGLSYGQVAEHLGVAAPLGSGAAA